MKASLLAIALFGLALVLLIARMDEADQKLYVYPAAACFFVGVGLALGGLFTLLSRRAWAAALVPALTLIVGAPVLFVMAYLTGAR